jgi:hypothetical protein
MRLWSRRSVGCSLPSRVIIDRAPEKLSKSGHFIVGIDGDHRPRRIRCDSGALQDLSLSAPAENMSDAPY